jgi:hypothetical protein
MQLHVPDKIIEEAMNVGGSDSRMLSREMYDISKFIGQTFTGGDTLEIGCYLGRVSYLFAYAHEIIKGGRHYAVDVYEMNVGDTIWKYYEHTEAMLKKNMGKYRKHVETVKGLSLADETLKRYIDRKYDCIFVDGDHRWGTLYAELLIADTLSENIMGHDFGHPEVTKAVDMYMDATGHSIEGYWRSTSGDGGISGLFKVIRDGKREKNIC